MPTPANVSLIMEFQDNRGFRATVRIPSLFSADITSTGVVLDDIWSASNAVFAAVQAMSNAKLIKAGWQFDALYAQEPSSETGVYQLVIDKAKLNGGDGNGGFQHIEIPAPKDALFETTTQDNLIVVNPGAGILTTFQGTLNHATAGMFATPRGGSAFAQFFGGQLVQGKPRRRRVLQGA